jgi:signal transduction histidine kinase
MIELHNGRIWAESEEGKGSTFSFLLPAKQAQKPLPSSNAFVE